MAVGSAFGQQPEPTTIMSDELHFIAFFPEKPKVIEGSADTTFGKARYRQWNLELPDSSYRVSVIDYSDLSIKMEGKPLNEFYDVLCDDLQREYGAKFGWHTDILFDELGRNAGVLTKNVSVTERMFLTRQRLYLVILVRKTSILKDEQSNADAKKFLDNFVFVKKEGNETNYSYGLPKSLSQNIEHK